MIHLTMEKPRYKVKLGAFGVADLWSSAVTDFMSLPDPITTDGVPYSHGGLVGKTATEVIGGKSFLEIISATVAPFDGGRRPGDCSHDAPTGRVCTRTCSYKDRSPLLCNTASIVASFPYSHESLGMRLHTSITARAHKNG